MPKIREARMQPCSVNNLLLEFMRSGVVFVSWQICLADRHLNPASEFFFPPLFSPCFLPLKMSWNFSLVSDASLVTSNEYKQNVAFVNYLSSFQCTNFIVMVVV